MAHLEQALTQNDFLLEAVRQAKATMAEPLRG
jgi:hypothetical protein